MTDTPLSGRLTTVDGVEIAYEHFKNGRDSLVIIYARDFSTARVTAP